MAFRLYIIPAIGDGSDKNGRRPKYFALRDAFIAPNQQVAWETYGLEAWFVVGADLTVSDDNLVVGQTDVIALPFDLSPLLSAANVTNIKNKLEAANIPAGWVTTSLTWLQVVRVVLGMFAFMQRFSGVYAAATGLVPPSLFAVGDLNTTFGSLSQAIQDAFVATAQSFGLSTTGLTASTTLRQILKAMADGLDDRQYNFSGTMI